MRIKAQEIPQRDSFSYLGSIISKDMEFDEDVEHKIKAGWLKWRFASGVFCDQRSPTRLKEKLYRTMIRPVMTYGAECLPIRNDHMYKMDVVEVRMLRWMCGKIKKDKIRNEHFREHLGLTSIGDKIKKPV